MAQYGLIEEIVEQYGPIKRWGSERFVEWFDHVWWGHQFE
jgi:hypothetical protein